MDFFAFATMNARTEFGGIAERFWVHFQKVGQTALEYWDEDFATLEEAREAATDTIEDRQADTAHITARIDPTVDEFYDVTVSYE